MTPKVRRYVGHSAETLYICIYIYMYIYIYICIWLYIYIYIIYISKSMVLRICNSLKYHGSPLRTILLGKLAGLAVSAVLSPSHSVPFHGSQKDGQPGPFRASCSSIMFN